MALPASRTGRALLGARAALGLSTLLAPRLAGKAFFLDPEDNPQLPVIGRMWGIRNLSLAAGMYGATGASRAQWWRLQPIIDVLDFLVIAREWRRGAVPGPAAGLMGGTALLATALGAASLGAETSQALRRPFGNVSKGPVSVWLGHGASGGAETMTPYIDALSRRSVRAAALRLPRGAAERAMEPLREQVGSELAHAVIGGHSFGGRVASLVAAQTAPAGLILLSYPLHRPGHPDELRIEHWPEITCPVLVLSGDRDQFARVDLLRKAVKGLAHADVHVYPGMRHGLTAVADDVAERIAAFLATLPARA